MTTSAEGTRFKKIAIDSLMIIFSVLFALFINKWSDSNKERKVTEDMLQSIKLELEENKDIAESLMKYHKSVYDTIGYIFEKDSLESYFFPYDYFHLFKAAPDGVSQQTLKWIAWDVAKQNGISSRISFNKSKTLFEVYAQIETVETTTDRIIDILSTREIQRKELLKESVIVLVSEFNELYQQEKTLMKKCERAVKELQK